MLKAKYKSLSGIKVSKEVMMTFIILRAPENPSKNGNIMNLPFGTTEDIFSNTLTRTGWIMHHGKVPTNRARASQNWALRLCLHFILQISNLKKLRGGHLRSDQKLNNIAMGILNRLSKMGSASVFNNG
ncbi:hypothetical protein C0J52_18136 [Blattella germanica]|nr:hypothetical protein C0J52_18136 [Blattella germanica]